MTAKPFRTIEENLRRIREEIEETAIRAGRDPSQIQLMAVTKTQPPQAVNAAIACGVTLLGENRAQELSAKYDQYDREGVSVHFIGGLQTNKVRQIVDKVDMIQSVDSLRLAEEIQKRSQALGKVMPVLIEVNIGSELTKSGIPPAQVEEFSREIALLDHLQVRGLMAIPPICDTDREIEGYFSRMHQLQVDMRSKKIDNVPMDVLSMGMSGDYRLAAKHGSTLLRLGSAIFGERVSP